MPCNHLRQTTINGRKLHSQIPIVSRPWLVGALAGQSDLGHGDGIPGTENKRQGWLYPPPALPDHSCIFRNR